MNKLNTRITALTGLLFTSLSAPIVHAAPGTLAETPLFLTTTVQPNILWLIDDSGSMDWEVLLSNGALIAHGGNPNSGNLDFSPDDTAEQLELCAGYNVLAYNPNVTYTPWAGKDSGGTTYANQSVSAARTNPYNTSGTRDLRNDFYFAWTDDGDGVYESGECPTSPAVNAEGDCRTNQGCYRVDRLSATEATNYANWYSYYRKREYVAKRAVSEVVNSSTARMGLATLHDNNSVFTAVKDIDNISTPVDATAQANKDTLLSNLFNVNSSGGTPLRQTLENAGNYYSKTIASSWGASPILPDNQGGLCQQNFTVMMSDGYWNGGDPSVGNTDEDGTGVFDGGSFADTYENTLADVAMHFYETDLSGNNYTNNQVPVLQDVDPEATLLNNNKMHPHMNTFTVAFGINGSLSDNPANQTDAFSWPEPSANTLTTIDDMRHAAWNGRGDFLSADDPSGLISSLDAALSAISGRTGSASSVTFNTGTLSANSQVYLALFNSERWSGDIEAYNLDATTGEVTTQSWQAAPKLDKRDLDTDSRVILTWNGTDGVPFRWSNLTTAQKNDLKRNSSGGTDNDATGMARMGFIRGDRVCESNYQGTSATIGKSSVTNCNYNDGTNTYNTLAFRNRNSRLGDIVHSGPVYVGAPEQSWSDNITTTPYSDYVENKKNRAGVIYVGANDGMLHAFSESDGREIMSYVPSIVYSTNGSEGLHYLTQPSYSHKYYVDLTPSVGDAYVKTTPGGATGWKTVLVGGLRGGGRGVFAIDVTTPSYTEDTASVTTPTPADAVMWEFSSADDADLGYTFSQPSIVPLENGKWAAVFGNGYNDTGSGTAQLFILDLEGGLDGTWTYGNSLGPSKDYTKIDTSDDNGGTGNGLSTPALVDTDGNGLVDRAYAGDLAGNLWAFDLSSNTKIKLFSAPANQQITVEPVVVRNSGIATTSSTEPNTLVMFGTGQYLTANDPSTASTQAFYGIWDHGSTALSQSDLVEQIIAVDGTTGARTLTDNAIDYETTTKHGWFINLPTSGERVVVSAAIRGDHVFFNTMIPDTGQCTYGGTGWLMVAKWLNGGRPDSAVFDLDGDQTVDSDDEIDEAGAAGKKISGLPSAPVNLGNKRYVSTTETVDGSGIESDDLKAIADKNAGRLSWEELFQ